MDASRLLLRLSVLLSSALCAAMLWPAAARAQEPLIVVGDTAAAACYRHARDGHDNREALFACDQGVMEARTRRDQGATHVNRAIIHILREEYEEALADVDKSFEYREFGEAYATRGVIFFHLGRMQESVEQASLALAQGDLDEPAKVYYNRGLAYENLEMIEEAYYDYLKASELDPGWRLPREELERFIVIPAGETGPAPAS